MNREIKFRVWDGKKYLHNDTFCLFPDDEDGFEVRLIVPYGILEACPNAVVQQYTGLKDRHEKEIYEGDIVKIIYDEAVAEVYFDFNLGAFRLKDNSGKSYPITTYRFDESNKPIGLISVVDEVIGNIMENPELLKA